MGFSARTVDPDVEGCNAKLALLEKDVGLLRKSLETFSLTLTQHTPAARAQMATVMMRLGETFVADGAHYASFREAQETLDGPCVEKLLTTFEAAVLQPMEEWVATFAEAKTGAVELDKLRVTFDHYREKLAALKKEKEAVILKGKVFDKASEEKLGRNADKLKEVRQGARAGAPRALGVPSACLPSHPPPCHAPRPPLPPSVRGGLQ